MHIILFRLKLILLSISVNYSEHEQINVDEGDGNQSQKPVSKGNEREDDPHLSERNVHEDSSQRIENPVGQVEYRVGRRSSKDLEQGHDCGDDEEPASNCTL